jgi:hypothetical protein
MLYGIKLIFTKEIAMNLLRAVGKEMKNISWPVDQLRQSWTMSAIRGSSIQRFGESRQIDRDRDVRLRDEKSWPFHLDGGAAESTLGPAKDAPP